MKLLTARWVLLLAAAALTPGQATGELETKGHAVALSEGKLDLLQ